MLFTTSTGNCKSSSVVMDYALCKKRFYCKHFCASQSDLNYWVKDAV